MLRSGGLHLGGKWGRRHTVAILLSLLLVLSTWNPAAAHGELERSEPAPDAVVAQAPEKVQLWFNEPIEPTFSEAVVYDDGGSRADLGDSSVSPADLRLLEVSLARGRVGTLTVDWRVLSKVDGHLTSGVFQFHVGSLGRAPVPDSAASSGGATTPLSVASKWLGMVAGFLLVGGAAFWLVVYRPLITGSNAGLGGDSALTDRHILALVMLAVVFLLLSLVLDLFAQSRWAGTPGAETNVAEALQTSYGRSWIARLAVLVGTAAITLLAALKQKEAWATRWVAAVGGLGAVLLLSYSALSHLTAAHGFPGAALDFIHLASASTWLGGLTALLGLEVPNLKSSARCTHGPPFREIVRRFSFLALTSVALVLMTGVLAALLQFDRPSDLATTPYGRALLVKLALLSPLSLLSFLQLSTVSYQFPVPALAAFSRMSNAFSRLVVLGRSELALGSMVLLAAVTMSLLPPAASGAALGRSGPNAASEPLRLEQSVGNLLATLDLDPRKVLSDRLVLSLVDPKGKPVEGAEVTYRTYSQDEYRGVISGQATPLGEGRYASGGLPSRPGRWMVEFDVGIPGESAVRVPFELDLGPQRSDVFILPKPGPSDPAAERMLAEAVERMRSLKSLRFDQVTDDGTGKNSVKAFVIIEAPDRLSLRIEGGAESLRIGSTWYSRVGDGLWSRDDDSPVPGGTAGFGGWLDSPEGVQFEGRETWQGRPARIISLLVPSLPAKYWEWLDEETGYIVREVMVAKAHYMTTELYGFDLPAEIEPPDPEHVDRGDAT